MEAQKKKSPASNSSASNHRASLPDNSHKKLAENMLGGLKLEPRLSTSWATQVEEEQACAGGIGPSIQDRMEVQENLPEDAGLAVGEAALVVDEAGKKVRRKKPKKRRGKASAAQDAVATSSAGQQLEEHLTSPPLGDRLPAEPSSNGRNLGENIDKKGNTAARAKGSNAVWALKRSDSGRQPDEPKVTSTQRNNDTWTSSCDDPSSHETGGGWDSNPQPGNEDLGWQVSGPYRSQGNAGGDHLNSSSQNGGWDDKDATVSNWESGWEVAGSRRAKKADEAATKYFENQRIKAGGRGNFYQSNQNEQFAKGAKQRTGEWDKGARTSGYGAQEKVGRGGGPRNFQAQSSFGASRQNPPSQSGWGKPLHKTFNNSLNADTQSIQESGTTGNSGSFLGKILPAAKPVPAIVPAPSPAPKLSTFAPAPAPVTHIAPADVAISLDAWKGGFPPFSGNGSFEGIAASRGFSDSQCSDDDFDSDSMSLASFDSDDSQKSHSTQRNNKWFRSFFQDLDLLTEQQLHDHDRQWHCPACQGGVGAIDWYRGLQPLLTHAKTVRSKRVKLHKIFAEVLEEEIRVRMAIPGTHGSGKYGKWRGLGDENENVEIVWPPMIIIRNTQLQKDEDDKLWMGMGNKELLDMFKKQNPVKARHAYGPQGHRGMSILIFAESPAGYYNAQRLETQFIEARRGKDNWDAPGKLLFQPGGDRILYGYIATREDMDLFNKHSKGKQNLKWELKNFHEVVLAPMRRLDNENKKVTVLEGKVQREMEATKVLKKAMSEISRKLMLREDELKFIRDRSKEQYEQQQTEMEDMETIYKTKIDELKREIQLKEQSLERVHEEYELEHMEQCEKLEQQASKLPKDQTLNREQQQEQAQVQEELAHHSKLVEMSIKNQEQWEAKKSELAKGHHQMMMDFKLRQWEELVNFEKMQEQEREEVMERFRFPTNQQ